MHPLNPYRAVKPNFDKLASTHPDFAPFVHPGPSGFSTIDFKDEKALRALTTALLKEDWDLDVDLREDRLCPTVTNRLDYVLTVLDLEPYLGDFDDEGASASTSHVGPSTFSSLRNESSVIRVLDLGTGHVAIYPLLLHTLRPRAIISATDIDETSLTHAQATLAKNDIPSKAIKLVHTSSNDPLLGSLQDQPIDVVMSNPPFFRSEEEMRESMELKEEAARTAATAAANESITPGGEVEFVGRIIRESTRMQDKAMWFTSLIGKYSSLNPLVELLQSFEVDNYFVKSIKQAKTSRWILGWSYGLTHLPDAITRPETIFPNTSFSRILPPPNRLTHTPQHPPLSVDQLREAVLPVLKQCQFDISNSSSFAKQRQDGSIDLSPAQNTWSRAARRQAAHQMQELRKDAEMAEGSKDPIMRARITFLAPKPPVKPKAARPTLLATAAVEAEDGANMEEDDDPSASTPPGGAEDSTSVTTNEPGPSWKGASLAIDFAYGKDRSLFETFWKFLLTKANLLGAQGSDHQESGATPPDRHKDKQQRTDGAGYRGGRGLRGGGGRGRGHDGGWRGRGGSSARLP